MALDDFKFYHYEPSLVAAIVFVVLFSMTTVLHCYQAWRTRCWVMLPLLIGGIFEVAGYAGRAISSQQTPNWTLIPYLIQTLFLLVAPALIAASIYMELKWIILVGSGDKRIALLGPRYLTKIFVAGDVLSFLLQSGGGGLQSKGTVDAANTGKLLIIGGLAVQLLFFALFIVVAIHFDLARRRAADLDQPGSTSVLTRKHLVALYVTSSLIMLRSVFRVAEYVQGFDGYLLSHEVYLYIFDASLMSLALLVLNFVHPSAVIAVAKGGPAIHHVWRVKQEPWESIHELQQGV